MITTTERDGTKRASEREIVRRVVLLAVLLLSAVSFVATGGAGLASAATPEIMNVSNSYGNYEAAANSQYTKGWLKNPTISDDHRTTWVTLTVEHDRDRSVVMLRKDDDYNATDSAATATPRTDITVERMNVAGGSA